MLALRLPLRGRFVTCWYAVNKTVYAQRGAVKW